MLALELRQFVGERLKTLVPMVYGQTEGAQQKKTAGGAPKRQWDRETFFADLERRQGAEVVGVAARIGDWMKAKADEAWYGRGAQDGSMGATFVREGQKFFPLNVWTNGRVEINFRWIMQPPFADEEKRRELLRRLNSVEGINFPPDAISRHPSIPLATLKDEKRLSGFLAAMDWFVQELRAA